MAQKIALSAAPKSAVQIVSKKEQINMIADHVYGKYGVFKRLRPLTAGIDQDLIAALSQYDPTLTVCVLANHCRRPRYLKALACGGKRFDLDNRFKGEVSVEKQTIVQQHPAVRRTSAAQTERQAAKAVAKAEVTPIQTEKANDAAE